MLLFPEFDAAGEVTGVFIKRRPQPCSFQSQKFQFTALIRYDGLAQSITFTVIAQPLDFGLHSFIFCIALMTIFVSYFTNHVTPLLSCTNKAPPQVTHPSSP